MMKKCDSRSISFLSSRGPRLRQLFWSLDYSHGLASIMRSRIVAGDLMGRARDKWVNIQYIENRKWHIMKEKK